MNYLATFRDYWRSAQERRYLRSASEVLLLADGRLWSITRGKSAECNAGDLDEVVQAAGSMGVGASAILLLPSEHFSTSEHQLLGLDRAALKQALHFQQDQLFPGMEQLRVTVGASEAPTLALWMRDGELEQWRQAFSRGNIALVAVGPSVLFQQFLGKTDFHAVDSASGVSATLDAKGYLVAWSLQAAPSEDAGGQGAGWMEFKGRWKLKRSDYLFPLRRASSRSRFGLLLLLALLAAALLLVYGVLPVVRQFNLKTELEQQVSQLREAASDVIGMREQAFTLEQKLAPVETFPKIKVAALLKMLDGTVPNDSWLLNMRVEESVVEIEGISPDPSRIIELLSARPEFSEVAFSKAIRKDPRQGEGKSRFGIRMKLSGIDFERWRQALRGDDE